MEEIFFFISNIGYLIKTDLSFHKKINIFLKSFWLYLIGGLKNRLGCKSFRFAGFKIHGLSHSTLRGLFLEIFVRNEYKFHATKHNPKILDLGANIGMATIYFKRLYPHAKIISFEPDHKHFGILQKNILENNLSDTVCEEKAVTNYTGEIVFYTDDKASFSMSTKKGRMAKIETKVQCISISDIINKEEVDVLKMDIEGGEFDVLRQLDISGDIKYINEMIIEYHHNIKDDSMSFAEFLGILEKNGSKYWLNTCLFPLEAKNKFQDIFVHAYKK